MPRHYHVNLRVADLDRARAFYERVLGFRPVGEHEGFVVLQDEGGLDLVLELGALGDRADRGWHWGVRFDDRAAVGAVERRLSEEGAAVVERSDEGGMHSVKFHDPDGYTVELYCYG